MVCVVLNPSYLNTIVTECVLALHTSELTHNVQSSGASMIRNYKLEQGRVVEAVESDQIMVVVEPTDAEKALLIGKYQIDEHNLTSAQDMDELPRVELEDNHMVVIFKHPKRYSAKDNLVFLINSVGLFLYEDRLIIVAPNDMWIFEGRAFNKVQNLQMVFLRILSLCVNHFLSHLQVINQISNELESQILKSMENRTLHQMFSIEKSLVYYVSAISSNVRVIEKLRLNAKNDNSSGLTPEMIEYVDDLAIENAQCLGQAQVYSNVLTGLMNARASVVSNNLNVLMKQLTVINVVFMPLNVLAGIGGMSEFSMMTNGIPWPVAYSAFIASLCVIGYITYIILKRFESTSFGK